LLGLGDWFFSNQTFAFPVLRSVVTLATPSTRWTQRVMLDAQNGHDMPLIKMTASGGRTVWSVAFSLTPSVALQPARYEHVSSEHVAIIVSVRMVSLFLETVEDGPARLVFV